MALLREQLRFLGDTLAGREAPEPARRPVTEEARPGTGEARPGTEEAVAAPRSPRAEEPPTRAWRPPRARRGLRLALGGLAAACAVAVVSTMAWLAVAPGGGRDDGSAASASDAAPVAPGGRGTGRGAPETFVACARLIVEGTVEDVAPRKDGSGRSVSRVTVRVDHYYKPAHGAAHVTFDLAAHTLPVPRPGDRVIAGVEAGSDTPGVWDVGDANQLAAARARVREGVAAAGGPSASPFASPPGAPSRGCCCPSGGCS